MRVRLIGVGLALTSAVSACTGPAAPGRSPTSAANQPSATPAVAASGDPTRSAWQNVLDRIGPNGEVDLQLALDAFVLAFGPLPGVAEPVGADGVIDDGTFALRAVRRHWAELSTEQQSAADTLMRGNPSSASVPARALAIAVPIAQTNPAIEGWQKLIEDAALAISNRLGRQLKAPIVVQLNDAPLAGGSAAIWDALAYERGTDAQGGWSGPMATCHIAVNPQAFNLDDTDKYALSVHEAFHCFQDDLGTLAASSMVSDWIIEGSAEWVGEELAGGTSIGASWWGWWLTTAPEELYGRSYDAIGIYALLDQGAANPWVVMDKFLLAGINGNDAAYEVLRQAGGAEFVDTWGPRYAMNVNLGLHWLFEGEGLLPGLPLYDAQSVTVGEGASTSVPASDHSANLFQAVLQADVITLSPTTSATSTHGLVWLKVGEELPLAVVAAKPLCTRPDGCTCPEGSVGAGTAFTPAEAGSVISVGFAAEDGGAAVGVSGLSVDQFCKKNQVDPCVVGTWVSQFVALDATVVTGGNGMILTVNPDGLTTVDYDLMEPVQAEPIEQPVPEVSYAVEMQWFGTANGLIRAWAGDWAVISQDVSDQQMSMAVYLDGDRHIVFDHASPSEVAGGGGAYSPPGGVTGYGFGTATYECTAATLKIITTPATTYSIWQKQK